MAQLATFKIQGPVFPADIMRRVYAVDDQTVTTEPGSPPRPDVGFLIEIATAETVVVAVFELPPMYASTVHASDPPSSHPAPWYWRRTADDHLLELVDANHVFIADGTPDEETGEGPTAAVRPQIAAAPRMEATLRGLFIALGTTLHDGSHVRPRAVVDCKVCVYVNDARALLAELDAARRA